MVWHDYLFLALGLVAGGGIGFAIGRYMTPSAAPITRAIEKEDAAETQADKDRQAIEDDLAAKIDETRRADALKLKELLDAGFADPSAPVQPGSNGAPGGPTSAK